MSLDICWLAVMTLCLLDGIFPGYDNLSWFWRLEILLIYPDYYNLLRLLYSELLLCLLDPGFMLAHLGLDNIRQSS